jgi:hypothetical protein
VLHAGRVGEDLVDVERAGEVDLELRHLRDERVAREADELVEVAHVVAVGVGERR